MEKWRYSLHKVAGDEKQQAQVASGDILPGYEFFIVQNPKHWKRLSKNSSFGTTWCCIRQPRAMLSEDGSIK